MNRSETIRSCKIIAGVAAASWSFLSAESTCAPNVFGLCYGTYLPFEMMQLSVTLLAAALLLSAFIDVFSGLERIAMPERGVESVAAPVIDHAVPAFGHHDASTEQAVAPGSCLSANSSIDTH